MRDDNTQGNQHTETEGHSCEEAEHILYPYERRVHLESMAMLDGECLPELEASNCIAFT
jgi:hypothetical protein